MKKSHNMGNKKLPQKKCCTTQLTIDEKQELFAFIHFDVLIDDLDASPVHTLYAIQHIINIGWMPRKEFLEYLKKRLANYCKKRDCTLDTAFGVKVKRGKNGNPKNQMFRKRSDILKLPTELLVKNIILLMAHNKFNGRTYKFQNIATEIEHSFNDSDFEDRMPQRNTLYKHFRKFSGVRRVNKLVEFYEKGWLVSKKVRL